MDRKLQPNTDFNKFRATNGEEYGACCREIYRHGQVVTVSMFAKDITESVVVELRGSGIRVDWHFHRNRIFVKTLDDVQEVRRKWWAAIRGRNLDRCWVA